MYYILLVVTRIEIGNNIYLDYARKIDIYFFNYKSTTLFLFVQINEINKNYFRFLTEYLDLFYSFIFWRLLAFLLVFNVGV